MTCTKTFTEISPYTTLSSPNAGGSVSLEVNPGQPAAWSMISADKPTSSYETGYMAVQVTEVTSGVVDPFLPAGSPRLEVAAGGAGSPMLDYSVPRVQGRVAAFARFYTRIFAINDKKIDAQGATVQLPRDSKSVYSLFNVGLHNDEGSESRAVATITYDGKIATV